MATEIIISITIITMVSDQETITEEILETEITTLIETDKETIITDHLEIEIIMVDIITDQIVA